MFLTYRSWHINLQLYIKYLIQEKLLLWHYCKLCGIPNTNLICNNCIYQLDPIPEPFCTKCLKPGNSSNCYCINCHDKIIYFDKLYCNYSYAKPLNKVLHALKYQKQNNYSWVLGYLLFTQIKQNYDVIIPVPLHPNKLKERGFNQAEKILDFSKAKQLPVRANWVIRTKDTPPQAQCDRRNRENNVSGVFELRHDVNNMKILIADDVVTTGSTINELAKLLKYNGAKIVDACALMRTI